MNSTSVPFSYTKTRHQKKVKNVAFIMQRFVDFKFAFLQNKMLNKNVLHDMTLNARHK